MNHLSKSALILLSLIALASCSDNHSDGLPGSPPLADFRLRSLQNVSTLGGRYQTSPKVKSAAVIVRFFKNGKQTGRGPLLTIPIRDGILDCEFLFQGKKGQIFTTGMGSTDTDDFYEKAGKSWSNSGSGNFEDLPGYKEVKVLGFATSGLNPEGKELAGTPDFNYHIENATHIVALFGVLSEKDPNEAPNLAKKLEAMPLGLAMSAQVKN